MSSLFRAHLLWVNSSSCDYAVKVSNTLTDTNFYFKESCSWILWFTHVITALGKLRQDNYQKFKVSLSYIISSRPAKLLDKTLSDMLTEACNLATLRTQMQQDCCKVKASLYTQVPSLSGLHRKALCLKS